MANYNLKNFYEWPLITRSLIIGLFCVVIFYLFYLWDISSLRNQLTTAEQQENDLKNQFQLLIKKEIAIKNEVANLPNLQTSLHDWQKKLTSFSELHEILSEILKIGAGNHLQFNLFHPEPKIKVGYYFKTRIKVNATGNYDEIANFISQIANLQKIVVVSNFIIEKSTLKKSVENESDDRNALTAEIILEIYQLPETTT